MKFLFFLVFVAITFELYCSKSVEQSESKSSVLTSLLDNLHDETFHGVSTENKEMYKKKIQDLIEECSTEKDKCQKRISESVYHFDSYFAHSLLCAEAKLIQEVESDKLENKWKHCMEMKNYLDKILAQSS